MKITIVHDHINQIGGAEVVLKNFQEIWPDAPTYTLQYNKKLDEFFGKKKIHTSFLGQFPFPSFCFRWFLPLMPIATEQYRLAPTDIVLSSSSAFAKGVIAPPDAYHICYCHTPTRYLWSDTNQYLDELQAPRAIKIILPFLLSRLRIWDFQAAQRVHLFLANSREVQKRIENYYHCSSQIVYPPVDTAAFNLEVNSESYFLTGGRLVFYKRFDIIIEAFNRLGRPLVIFGNGPEAKHLKKIAKSNIVFTGYVTENERAKLFSHCRAFIAAQREDFGLTTAEATAAGRPVIAYRAGGSLEIVEQGISGVFFDDQCWEALADSVLHFQDNDFDSSAIRQRAERFSKERFQNEIKNIVNKLSLPA